MFFFICCYGDPRDLHSFPTRRSSDLALIRKLEGELEQAAGVLRTQPEHLVHRIEQLLEANRKLEKRVEELLKTGGGKRETGNVERIGDVEDRKSTRLNSSHTVISYAVFCLKKKMR